MGNEAGMASAANDGTRAAAAGGIKDAIESAMATGGAGLTPQELAARDAARAARLSQGANYERGAVGEVLANNRYGEPVMNAENVPGTLLGGPTAVRQTETAARGSQVVRDQLAGAFAHTMQQAVQTAAPDAAGNWMNSAARFHDFVAQNEDAIRYLYGARGVRNLQQVGEDLASRQMIDTTGRVAGSSTVQNMSTAHVLGAAFGGLINPETVLRNPLFRYASGLSARLFGTNQVLPEMLNRAMLDPAYAQLLASRATPQTIRRAAALLQQSPGQRLRGAAAGALQPMIAPGAVAAGSPMPEQPQR
jgi:hypothetical protein